MDNTNAISLMAASVSAVVVIGLMATYVQIMTRLIDKKYELLEKNKTSAIGKIHSVLRLLTCQVLLFFLAVLLLLILMGYFVCNTLQNNKFAYYSSLIIVGIIFISQIIHFIVFKKSFWEYIYSKEEE